MRSMVFPGLLVVTFLGCADPGAEEGAEVASEALTTSNFVGAVYASGSSRLELFAARARNPDDRAAGYLQCKHSSVRECVWQRYREQGSGKEFLAVWLDGNLDRNEVLEGGLKLRIDGTSSMYTWVSGGKIARGREAFVGAVYESGTSRLELLDDPPVSAEDRRAGFWRCQHSRVRECVWEHYREDGKEFLGVWLDGNLDRNEVVDNGRRLRIDGTRSFYTLTSGPLQ